MCVCVFVSIVLFPLTRIRRERERAGRSVGQVRRRRRRRRHFTLCPSSQQHQASRNTGSWHNNYFLIPPFLFFSFVFPPFWCVCVLFCSRTDLSSDISSSSSLFFSVSGASRILPPSPPLLLETRRRRREKTRWTENGATKEEFFLKPSDIVFFFSFFFYRFLTLDCRITDHARRRPPSCPSCDPTSSADATLSTTKTTTKSSDFILARRTQASKLKPEECEGEIQGHDLWR